MQFESKFTLNRAHLAECYDQSVALSKKTHPRYLLMAGLLIAAIVLFILGHHLNHIAFFLIGLAVLEFMSFKYRRAWWLTRQLWSKNSGNTVTLTINPKGIQTKSLYINNQLLWRDVKKMDSTEQGIILTLNNGSSNYLSKNCISQEAIYFIKAQVSTSLADR